MYKFNSEKEAIEKAKELDLCYGWSIFSTGWYVGSEQELKKIGVLDSIKPNIDYISDPSEEDIDNMSPNERADYYDRLRHREEC